MRVTALKQYDVDLLINYDEQWWNTIIIYFLQKAVTQKQYGDRGKQVVANELTKTDYMLSYLVTCFFLNSSGVRGRY